MNTQHKIYKTLTDKILKTMFVYFPNDTKTDRQDSVNEIASIPNSETEDDNTDDSDF